MRHLRNGGEQVLARPVPEPPLVASDVFIVARQSADLLAGQEQDHRLPRRTEGKVEPSASASTLG